MKPVKFIRSKLIAAGVAGGLFVAAWAWAAAAGWQGAPAAPVVAGPAPVADTAPQTVVQRVYLVQRTAPDGSTYMEALPAPPAGAAASIVAPVTSSAPPRPATKQAKPVTKTRAS